MQSKTCFEVAIVGGGMVGASLARALEGERIALIAPRPASPARDDASGFDSRVYAISPGNAAFLQRLGAWDAIPPERLTPVHAMRVQGDDGSSAIEFDAYRSGVGELAWIVEDRLVQGALWRALEAQAGLELIEDAVLERIELAPQAASLVLAGSAAPESARQGSGGRRIEARLVIGADGARSSVRAQAGIASREQGYGQAAVVANFACSRPHRNVAFQWFQGADRHGAVLALLPLPGDRVSMVWSVAAAEAQRLLALEPEALCREVALASYGSLGELSLVTAPRAFALQRLAAGRLVASRVALAGDSAHVIHPLAGQGANLGLQDAKTLAEVIAAREPGRDPGELRLLRRYERARAEDILAMRATVHGLYRLFGARGAPLARLRNAGLKLADRLPVLKSALIRHAMG
jgi:ubiquinone biosynthesis UbiH/UbiF/VisC/COQ6 family hydroxylase